LASRDYMHAQQVSAQVHAMLGDDGQPLFDGVLYPSRNNYPAASIALFERAGTTASAWSPTPARWNRMTKRPEAARKHIEARNGMKWSKQD
jgi:hypothetical protein